MATEVLVVPSFTGIKRPGFTGRITERRELDQPFQLYNFHHTRDGHLYMPPAAGFVHDFTEMTGESAATEIRSVFYIETPRGLLVQSTSGRIYHISIEPPSTVGFTDDGAGGLVIKHVATMGSGEEEWPLWINGIEGATLFGYCPRGSAGPDGDGRTWKLDGDYDDPTTTDLSATLTPTASASIMYKGRRFWVNRGRQVYFSDLNTPDEAPADASLNTFRISGDDSGESFLTNPGSVSGMSAWENVLVFFLSGSVWLLTGSDPDNYTLNQVQTIVGNTSQNTIVRTDEGVLTFGGANLNTQGVYLFTGSRAVLLSDDMGDYMADAGERRSATFSGSKYLMSSGRADPESRQILVYDTATKDWTTFDGFVNGVVSTQDNRVLVSGGGVLYRSSSNILPRAPGRGARLVVGYQDDENPSGRVRYLAVKVAGRHWGSGAPTMKVTAITDTDEVTSAPFTIPSSSFDGLVLPVNIRGTGVRLVLEIENTSTDDEVLIENIQVVTSRKGEKVSRA